MREIGLVAREDGREELGYKNDNFSKLSEGLKKLVFKALLRKKNIQLYEKQGERIIKGLFEVYTDTNFNNDLLLLPPELRVLAKNNEASPERVVVDYIAGMMDSFAMQEYQKYFGSSSLDMIYDKNI